MNDGATSSLWDPYMLGVVQPGHSGSPSVSYPEQGMAKGYCESRT